MAVYKLIFWVEDTLIKSQQFSLSRRKARLKSDVEYELVFVEESGPSGQCPI